jgi:hypothetical protein
MPGEVYEKLTGTMQNLLKFGSHRITSLVGKISLQGRFGTPNYLEVTEESLVVFGTLFTKGIAPPTTGDYIRGSIVWNEEATSEIVGWVCIQSGTPGVWSPFGNSAGGDVDISNAVIDGGFYD